MTGTHGGAREGAGRPRVWWTEGEMTSIVLPKRLKEKVYRYARELDRKISQKKEEEKK
jgi:hypothetical protein